MAEVTTTQNVYIPQVLGDMVEEKLPHEVRFRALATVDDTLVGQPGNTVTLPAWEYIGDAQDLEEGGELQYSKLTTTSKDHKVKKAVKGVTITDEAISAGYDQPVEAAARQISKSLAQKEDADILTAALGSPLFITADVDLDLIDAIEDKFGGEDDDRGVIVMNKVDAGKLRKAAAGNWTRASQLGDTILVKGTFGELLGWQIVKSNRLPVGTMVAIKEDALTLFLKKELQMESERDLDHFQTKYAASEHYVAALTDAKRVVVVKPKNP